MGGAGGLAVATSRVSSTAATESSYEQIQFYLLIYLFIHLLIYFCIWHYSVGLRFDQINTTVTAKSLFFFFRSASVTGSSLMKLRWTIYLCIYSFLYGWSVWRLHIVFRPNIIYEVDWVWKVNDSLDHGVIWTLWDPVSHCRSNRKRKTKRILLKKQRERKRQFHPRNPKRSLKKKVNRTCLWFLARDKSSSTGTAFTPRLTTCPRLKGCFGF